MFIFVIYNQLARVSGGRSLQLVTAMRSSVSLLYSFCLKVQPLATVKSSGSQVAAVYLIWVNSVPFPDHQLRLLKLGKLRTSQPFLLYGRRDGSGNRVPFISFEPRSTRSLLGNEVPFPRQLYASRCSSPLWDRLTPNKVRLG